MENKKRVLITGCSSGFGLYTAIEAAKAGFDTIATMRNPKKTAALENALKSANVTATIDILDVTDPENIKKIAEKYAPIDILINNAGILITGSFLDLSMEESRLIFETNYFGPVALTRAVAGQMIERKQGLIINVASLAGLVGHMFNAAYSSSKHALVGFSRSIHTELKPFNIDVVCVEPGYHKTEIIGLNANVAENFYNPDSAMADYNRGFLRLMLKEIVPRAGAPEGVTKLILKIMQTKNPKTHYTIGKDAALILTAKKLGLQKLLEKTALKKLLTATRREKRRQEARKQKRKNKQ
ncbi:MAG: SDR family oxidoreductase [Planctomycetes bacterium]|nr:SDR family oxidoreductase [Planctomycetota bacterium]